MTHAHAHECPVWPSPALPAGGREQRLVGLYPQRQEGLFMQRLKLLGGRLTAEQWRGIGDLVERFTLTRPSATLSLKGEGSSGGRPLHLTTRQDVEFHNVAAADVPGLQRGLADLGLTAVGACGDTVRNVTVCHGSGLRGCGLPEVMPLATAIRDALMAHPSVFGLPRKFKVTLSACHKGCSRPYISDLAFVGRQDGRLAVIGAGSLGARPATGIELYEAVEVADAVPLALAALDLFDAEGDRQNRNRARLRHVRERLGDAEFRRRLDERFQVRRGGATAPAINLRPPGVAAVKAVRLQFPCGDVTAAQARALGDLAAEGGVEVRIGLQHGVRVYRAEASQMPAALAGVVGGPKVVCCPGADTCPRGLTHTRRAAQRIAAAMVAGELKGIEVNISGCPNGCAHSAVATVGLAARVRQVDGQPVECYQVLTGGGRGRGPELAQPVGEPVAEERIVEVLREVAATMDSKGGD